MDGSSAPNSQQPPLYAATDGFQRRQPARSALILYGSETGNAQDVAEEVGRLAERLRFDTAVRDLASIGVRDLVTPTFVVFALSTTGQGEMPQSARTFWAALLSSALRPGVLRRLRFASFGLGDSSYARYNVAHRMLCGRLLQLGGVSICERGEGNEQHPEGHSAGFREWIGLLKRSLLETFPLPDGVEPLADDVFLEPKWKLEMVAVQLEAHTDHSLPRTVSDDNPSSTPLPVKGAYMARVFANERVTATDHFQDTRLLDLRLDDDMLYKPGAVAVVYPKNFPADVQAFIELMDWQPAADQPLKLIRTGPDDVWVLSPLRHLDLSTTTLSLRWLLENVLDIMAIPRRSFFAGLAHVASSDTDDDQYQKDRLLELANPDLIDELWDYTTRPKRTILEVMMDFTTVRIPWQYCLNLLPLIKGRQFSIASGGNLLRPSPPNTRGTRVQLLIAILNPPSPIIKHRPRHGVGTRYIASLIPGVALPITLQPGYLNPQPSDLSSPAIMIGPGTGLAPLRSLIHQRLLWAQDRSLRSPGALLHPDVLVFGCRGPHADLYFGTEWDDLVAREGLIFHAAFSRVPGQSRKYVQDAIRARAEGLYDALVRDGARVYVCGSSGEMPRGVREALIEVLEHGKPAEADGNVEGSEWAEAYLGRMEKEGRYFQETW